MREQTPSHHRQRTLWTSLIALFLCACNTFVVAQDTRLADLYRQSWTTRDGLPHNSINAIAETPGGYLWFATWEGVARFNGREFVNFDRQRVPQMLDSSIRALRVDQEGRLLIGGGRGGLLMQGSSTWTALPSAPGLVTEIAHDHTGALWVGTESNGVWRIGAQGETRAYGVADGLLSLSTHSVVEDGDKQLWVATPAGLHRYEGEGFYRPDTWPGLPAGPTTTLSRDDKGRLLAATPMGAFVNEGGTTPRFALLHPSLAGIGTTSLMAHPDGSTWVGTRNQGLMRVGRFGLESLGTGAGMPFTRILSLHRDREGNVWVGTHAGLFRFSDAPFVSITSDKGLSNNYVRTVLALPDGSVLAGTSQGLNRWADERVERIGKDTLLENLSILSLARAPNGDLWVGSLGDGVLRWSDGRVAEQLDISTGLISNDVLAIAAANDGSLWLGTSQGLVRRTARGFEYYTKANGLSDNFVMSLQIDQRGRVWVGTGRGASVWEAGQFRAVDLSKLEGAASVFDFYEEPDGRAMWLATDRGLLRLPEGGTPGGLGLQQGLPFEKVFGLTADGLGNLWMSGNRGVVRLDHAQAQEVSEGRGTTLTAERFTEADGMASAQCNGGSSPAIALSSDGSIWVPTAMGLAGVEPKRLQRFEQMSPPVVIESLLVDGVERTLDGLIRLAPGTTRIEIYFAGLSYVMPERIRYRQRLRGFDADWVERGSNSRAEYTNLQPGDYVFEVEAAHPRGDWGQSPAQLSFSVMPGFWQQPVTWAVIVLLCGAALFGGVAWRLKAVSANERRLERVVAQRTAELQAQKQQLHEQSERFARQASEDPLTGLANRRGFDAAIGREFSRWQRAATPLCVAMLDIDHFKQINDRWSHDVGDIVLTRLADLLREDVRAFDVVARWGGEEFVVLMPETGLDKAIEVCERLRVRIAAMDFASIDTALHITVSFGVCAAEDGNDQARLISRADAALYRAKAKGRNRIET